MSVNIGTRRWDSRGFWCRVRYTWRKRHCEQRKVEEGEQHLPFGEAKCVYFPTRTTAKLTQPCKLRTRTREKAAEKSGNVSFSTENERLLAGALLHRAAGLGQTLGGNEKNGGIHLPEYRRWGNSYGVYFAKTRSPRILAKAISN